MHTLPKNKTELSMIIALEKAKAMQDLTIWKAEILEEVEKLDCDFCHKQGKVWDMQQEKMIECTAFKHSVIKLLKSK